MKCLFCQLKEIQPRSKDNNLFQIYNPQYTDQTASQRRQFIRCFTGGIIQMMLLLLSQQRIAGMPTYQLKILDMAN